MPHGHYAGEAKRTALEFVHRLLVLQKPEFVRGLPWPRRRERLRDGQYRPRLDVGLSFGERTSFGVTLSNR